MNTKRFPEIIIELYRLTEELENMFPGRHFTPDGHLVGSIGEALAAYHYGVELLTASSKGQDATWQGCSVEIKATRGDRVALRHRPERLLVLKLHADGTWSQVYNGLGDAVWDLFAGKTLPVNGQHSVQIKKLQELMKNVPQAQQIPLSHPVVTPYIGKKLVTTRHKVITEVVNYIGQDSKLGELLNAEAANGWRVRQVSTGIYRRKSEYHADTHCVVLEETEARFEYACIFYARPLPIGSASARLSLNDVIEEQESKGYLLTHLTQTAVINPDQDRQASLNSGHLLIFERAL